MSETFIPLASLLTSPVNGTIPVDPHWTCHGSGDCCSKPEEVVMTKDEAMVLTHVAPAGVRLQFRPMDDGFVALKAQPCPLFIFKTCTVYEHRPFNCRRFMCMRPDPSTEPLIGDGETNWRTRVEQNRGARRLYARNQRKHSRWALKHGWKV